MENKVMIRIDHVSKEYKLGSIGGTTLRDDLSRWMAKFKGKEDPTLKIGQQSSHYGDRFLALDDVTFDVQKGEAVGIIGHNGAGKSTLLKLLSRVTAPTNGSIGLNGRVASMLEVGTGFHPELTGRENIYMNGAILGMTKAEIDQKIEEIIDFSECRDFIDTPVKRYSSGMYVKLAFSVAAHLDSEIMIMDEVLAVGDMKFQQKCLGRMSSAAQNDNKTILYVSHNMNTIKQLCTRCIVLEHGRVIFNGDVDQAIELYMNSSSADHSVDIDLSQKRLDYLSPIAQVKMMRVQLCNKEMPVYEYGEDIVFDLTIHSKIDVPDLCARVEIRSLDGASVATSTLPRFAHMQADSEETFSFSLTPSGLVPGHYTALLVVYQVNEMGTSGDLDAVLPAFTFEVQDNDDQLKINWNTSTWGRINWESLRCLGKKYGS